jgi:transposase
MSFFIGVDVSKEEFDVCCIGEQEEKIFSFTCSMDRRGFEKLALKLPTNKSSFLLGMESTASCQYHNPYDSRHTIRWCSESCKRAYPQTGSLAAYPHTGAIMNLLNQRMKHDTKLLWSIKGIGENTAINFLIEMGGDVEMYKNNKKLIAASGLDPSTYQSGTYEGKSRISKRGNRHLLRVIWLMATKVIINNNLFRGYFYKRRNEGLPYKMDVLATAHKLIRIMFVMLSRKTYFIEGRIKYS